MGGRQTLALYGRGLRKDGREVYGELGEPPRGSSSWRGLERWPARV
ncbi:hypothetical protein [Thermoproteus uzoniensis]|nr:hypothetical protein [Thermoproteus uzoniensis]